MCYIFYFPYFSINSEYHSFVLLKNIFYLFLFFVILKIVMSSVLTKFSTEEPQKMCATVETVLSISLIETVSQPIVIWIPISNLVKPQDRGENWLTLLSILTIINRKLVSLWLIKSVNKRTAMAIFQSFKCSQQF